MTTPATGPLLTANRTTSHAVAGAHTNSSKAVRHCTAKNVPGMQTVPGNFAAGKPSLAASALATQSTKRSRWLAFNLHLPDVPFCNIFYLTSPKMFTLFNSIKNTFSTNLLFNLQDSLKGSKIFVNACRGFEFRWQLSTSVQEGIIWMENKWSYLTQSNEFIFIYNVSVLFTFYAVPGPLVSPLFFLPRPGYIGRYDLCCKV